MDGDGLMTTSDVFQLVRLDKRDEFLSAVGNMDINQVNESGQNLLHEAVTYNNVFAGEEVLRRHIDVNHKDSHGQTPLHYAALHQTLDLASLIIESGGNPNELDEHGNGPLWVAVFNARGKYGLVELLVKHGADPVHKNKHGRSPSDFARQIQDSTLVRLLRP
jgi:ankyrin repeat protein